MNSKYNLVLERDINQIISLDTNQRSPNKPIGNFIFDKLSQYNGANRLGIRDLTINLDMPNINVYNNSFSVNNVNVSIPVGYYDNENDLAQAIQQALTTTIPALGLITVTYSTVEKKYSISNATNTVMNFVVPKPCQQTTGLITSNSYPYKSIRPTMIYTNYIDVISNRLTGYSKGDETMDGRFNIIDRIYVGRADYLSFFGWSQYSNIKWFRFPSSANLGFIDIQLRDEYGNILEENKNVGAQFRLIMTLLTKEDLEESNN